MRTFSIFLVALVLGALGCTDAAPAPATALASERSVGTSACAAAVRGGEVASGTVALRVAAEPCEIETTRVTVLRASADGSRPDPGLAVVMTSDGRFITTSRYTTAILEWSPNGDFIQSVGREGEGPGEFSPRGALTLFIGPADSVFVLDGAQRWSVFAPDLTFARSFTGERTGRGRGDVHVVGGHGIVTTGRQFASSVDHQFSVTTLDGATARGFGPPVEDPMRYPRMSATDGEGLWVLPQSGTSGIVLERWTYDGQNVSRLEYDAPWLPLQGYPDADIQGEPELPEYDALHVDPDGLVWVPAAVRDSRWRAVEGPEKADMLGELYDGRLVVVNPRTAEVVASLRIDSPIDEQPPFQRFISGRRAYRVLLDSTGTESLEIVDVQLTAGQ